jgi:hypothetical protein
MTTIEILVLIFVLLEFATFVHNIVCGILIRRMWVFSLELQKSNMRWGERAKELEDVLRDVDRSFTLGFACPDVSPSEVIVCQREKIKRAIYGSSEVKE